MKCNHPHCFATVDPGSALYLSLDTIDETLGRPAKISDIKNFAVHALHGYGSTREYLEHAITLRQSATPAPVVKMEKKTPIEQLIFRAICVGNSRGLSTAGALKAAKKAHQLDIPVEKAVRDFARGEHLAASNRAKKLAAQPAA